MTPMRRRYFERRGVAVGVLSLPLFPEDQETMMMANQTAADEKLQAIAKILGVTDMTDTDSIRAALDALLSTVAGGEPEALSARELAMCSERKIDPVQYAAKRAAIRALSSR